MNIKLLKILDAGVSGKERVYLKATAADNLGSYFIFDLKQITPSKISSRPKSIYWFPDKKINTGDKILLYTGIGKNVQSSEDDVTTWFFYWGKPAPLWSEPDRGALLLKAEDWNFKGKDS